MKHRFAPYLSICLAILTGLAFFGMPKIALGLNYGYIVSDFEFFDYNSLSLNGIQSFLGTKTGILATKTHSTNQGVKTSAEIIYNAAREYGVSPKVILVTLQKEQSLIMNANPSSRAFDFAMGYGCPDSGGCSEKARGFFNQIDFATWQFRRYADAPGYFTYKVGNTYTIDGKQVTIQNQATAGLYNYTPHLHGNEMFEYWWSQWFKLVYPDGVLLRVKNQAGISLIVNGERRGFSDGLAMISRGYLSKDVLVVTQAEIEKYPVGKAIRFAHNAIVQDETGKRYMIDNLEKRLIPTQAIFDDLGFHQEEVQTTTADILSGYADGNPLNASTSYPTGVLVQNKKTGAIGYVKDGVLRIFHSKEILRNNFPRGTWIRVSSEEFEAFPKGPAMTLKDGTLVRLKNSPHMYVISGGVLHHIPSRAMFNALGFSLKNVLIVDKKSFSLTPMGNPLGS